MLIIKLRTYRYIYIYSLYAFTCLAGHYKQFIKNQRKIADATDYRISTVSSVP